MGKLLWFLSRSDHCKPQRAGDQNILFCGLFSRSSGLQALRSQIGLSLLLFRLAMEGDWPLFLINKSFHSTWDVDGGDN